MSGDIIRWQPTRPSKAKRAAIWITAAIGWAILGWALVHR